MGRRRQSGYPTIKESGAVADTAAAHDRKKDTGTLTAINHNGILNHPSKRP